MEFYENPSVEKWDKLAERGKKDDSQINSIVENIIDRVKKEGDKALFELSQEIDKVKLSCLQVSENEISEADKLVPDSLKKAIKITVANVKKFHEAQLRTDIDMETMPGVRCVQKSIPIQNIGLYIPGGSAPLFSTVIMLAVPAKIVGCPNIQLCTPTDQNGKINPAVLYTAKLCGVNVIYKAGGAQAIAAMAYGTESIKKVDKIFGPGNRFVMKAKQMVSFNQTEIDMPAGPSEVMILADDSADPSFVAADILSQLEHGPDSQALFITNQKSLAGKVEEEIEKQQKVLSRNEIARKSLEISRIIYFNDTENMIGFANTYAPEHLIISMKNPWNIADRITSAGSIFLGNYSPESGGDYATGTNHTLPTSGWGKSYSGVNTDSFIRKITYQELSKKGLENLSDCIIEMAENEGLDAHANAVKIRLNK